MSQTKRQIVELAFENIGLVNYTMTPDQLQRAVSRLDNMMATWNTKGIRLGYAQSSDPTATDLDTESGIPDGAYETVSANLALRLAPGFGKAVAVEVKTTAHEGYRALLGKAAVPHVVSLTSLPQGQGNKQTRAFFADPEEPLDANIDGQLEF